MGESVPRVSVEIGRQGSLAADASQGLGHLALPVLRHGVHPRPIGGGPPRAHRYVEGGKKG